MRNTAKVVLASALLAGTVVPTYSSGLLGGLLGDGDALITLNQEEASDTGLVNLGLGGDDGNLLDLHIGDGDTPLVDADVDLLSHDNLLEVDANVLDDTLDTNVEVIGDDHLLDVDLDLLDDTVDTDINVVSDDHLLDVNAKVLDTLDARVVVGGDNVAKVDVNLNNPNPTMPTVPVPPGNSNNDSNNPTNPNNPNIPGIPGTPGLPGAISVGGGNSGAMPACDNGSADDVVRLIQGTRADASWARASGVKVQRVDLCPEVQIWLAAQLQGSNLGNSLRAAVQSDALLNASLSRTSYSPDRVFAINERNGQLVVYVY